jgi:hypothetical protein
MVDRRNIKTKLSECQTLSEYRFWILKEIQQDVASRASVPQGAISKIEVGKTVPHTMNWAKLAQAYGLSLKEFTRLLAGGLKHGTQREGLHDAEAVPGTGAADDATRGGASGRLSAGLDQPGGAGTSPAHVAPNGAPESVPA